MNELVQQVNKDWQLVLPESLTALQLHELLAIRINELIKEDFDRLVQLLYRMDVSEAKIKNCLQEAKGKDAGAIIAELVIQRELQKIATRQQFRQPPSADEAERW